MKKLLLILMVVALASFLFVGCIPGVVVDDDEEDEDEVEIDGKKYIKGGVQTLTVTFAEPTEQVSVYVTENLKDNPVGVPTSAEELVVYPDADFKVWTATNRFGDAFHCEEGYIYVSQCGDCAPCKFPYVVDEFGPCSEIDISEYPLTGCAACGGVNINFATEAAACATCCGDECTSLDTAIFNLYKTDPFDECCDLPCIPAIATCTSTGCDIDCTISCFNIYDHYIYIADATIGSNDSLTFAYGDAIKTFYLVATLADKVGNETYYYAKIALDSAEIHTVEEYFDDVTPGYCTTWTTGYTRDNGVIGKCATSGVCP